MWLALARLRASAEGGGRLGGSARAIGRRWAGDPGSERPLDPLERLHLDGGELLSALEA
ncbi:hypothetical protein VB734_08215 [Synechococcus sp. BA-124 BA4]|nr:hypothetical protein [Synechococcus sp. BA-124 BA4]